MKMEGSVTISKDTYLRLLKAELKLSMLEGGGVDNWSGYNDSLNSEYGKPYREEAEDLKRYVEGI